MSTEDDRGTDLGCAEVRRLLAKHQWARLTLSHAAERVPSVPARRLRRAAVIDPAVRSPRLWLPTKPIDDRAGKESDRGSFIRILRGQRKLHPPSCGAVGGLR